MKLGLIAISALVISLNVKADMNTFKNLNFVQIVSSEPTMNDTFKKPFLGFGQNHQKQIAIIKTEAISESKAKLSILVDGKDVVTAFAFLRVDLPGQPASFELPLFSNSKTDENCGPLHEETLVYTFETQNALSLQSVQAISRFAPNCNEDNELESAELFSVVSGLDS